MGKYQKVNSPKQIFNPTLFWDAENIDIEKNARYIISRILDYGNENDIRTLRKLYTDEQLIAVIKNKRGLLPKTAKFWAFYFKIPLTEIVCLKKYYQKKQSEQ